jgi:hypothetical protein
VEEKREKQNILPPGRNKSENGWLVNENYKENERNKKT